MHHTSTCRLLTETQGDLTLVRLGGKTIDLDEANTLWLRRELLALVEAGQVRLALDLGNVNFVTSTMVEMLLSLHRRLQAQGGHLSVCNLTKPVAEVFSVLKLASILDIRSTLPVDPRWN